MEVTFERDDRIYLVASVTPVVPTESEIEDFAFSKAITDAAPNPHIGWYRGQYVEADNPNANGVMWASADLAIASVSPMLMPVTVMHDPRTAVGLIADTRLVTREAGAPRSRLDTALAIWKHRFPDVEEEAQANYRAGGLMQSMECVSSHYDCSSCGKSYVRQPEWAEKTNWCAHLQGQEGPKAARILRNVCFTGTGLIFASRGAKGAYTEAHLAPLIEDVAAFHQEARHTPTKSLKPKPWRRVMEIEDKDYAQLIAERSELATAKKRLAEVEPALEKAQTELAAKSSEVDKLEIEKKAAEDRATEEETKRKSLEETARAATLAQERTGKLGSAFLAKLPDSVKTRLTGEQAQKLSDEDWTARCEELAEMVGVKHDDSTPEPGGGPTFKPEDVARAGLNAGTQTHTPTPELRRSVVAGLIKPKSGAAK